MSYDFSGKRALVTGVSTGMGREMAKRLLELNATVFGLDNNEEGLKTLKAEHPEITTLLVELRNWDETRKAIQSITPIQLLVNNAGVGEVVPFLEITDEGLSKILDINLKALFNTSSTVAGDLIKRGMTGSIVNISSHLAKNNHYAVASYCASKAGVDSLTRCMTLELTPKGIKVNAVSPSSVMTTMGAGYFTSLGISHNVILDRIPAGRFPTIKDIVNAVMYLLSDESSMVNGTSLSVDGGHHVT